MLQPLLTKDLIISMEISKIWLDLIRSVTITQMFWNLKSTNERMFFDVDDTTWCCFVSTLCQISHFLINSKMFFNNILQLYNKCHECHEERAKIWERGFEKLCLRYALDVRLTFVLPDILLKKNFKVPIFAT